MTTHDPLVEEANKKRVVELKREWELTRDLWGRHCKKTSTRETKHTAQVWYHCHTHIQTHTYIYKQ